MSPGKFYLKWLGRQIKKFEDKKIWDDPKHRKAQSEKRIKWWSEHRSDFLNRNKGKI